MFIENQNIRSLCGHYVTAITGIALGGLRYAEWFCNEIDAMNFRAGLRKQFGVWSFQKPQTPNCFR
jgi:hypothetical protein